MANVPSHFDFDQISAERRATLELVLVVVLLGLLVNAIVSALFVFVSEESAASIVVISLILSVILLVLFIPSGLLKRAELVAEIPVVLFFDAKAKTISLPIDIRFPQPRQSGLGAAFVGSIPFPIAARLYFDWYKHREQLEESDLSDIIRLSADAFAPMIQFMVLHHYMNAHAPSWGATRRVVVGPFDLGHGKSLPSSLYGRSRLGTWSKNPFFQLLNESSRLCLPEGTDLEFSSNTVRLDGRLFTCELVVLPASIIGLQTWPLAIGTISSWYRDLSSDYSDTHAFCFFLRMHFTLKVRLWRFLAEDWVPKRLRPEVTLRDITDWINGWVHSTNSYLDWVDEDLDALTAFEVAHLIDEAKVIYKPKVLDASPIHFKISAPATPSAGSTAENVDSSPANGTGSGEEGATTSQKRSIESHGGSVELEHDFLAAVEWLRSVGEVELSTSKPTRFTAEAAITKRGVHQGDSVIVFRQLGREYGRAYACCWGHYYNCNRTRIGMYCAALDAAM